MLERAIEKREAAEAALRNLIAAAEPVDLHLRGKRCLKSRECEELTVAVAKAKEVLK